MTGDTSHILIAMRELIVVGRNVAPRRVVFANGFRVSRLFVVVARSGSHRIECLRDAPPTSGDDHRVLHDVTGLQINIDAFRGLPFSIASYSLEKWNARAFSITDT